NVARPRSPVLVGSCAGDGVAVVVQDSFAFTAAGATRITNVARPNSPFVVSTITGHGAGGIAVRDTFLYLPAGYDTVWVYSVAQPSAPRLVGYTPMLCHLWDIALADSVAAVATIRGMDILSLGNPAQPQRLGGVTTPYGPRRVVWSSPHFYAAMWEAGVGVYVTESTGIAEHAMAGVPSGPLLIVPNPVGRNAEIRADSKAIRGAVRVTIRDVTGRVVALHCAEANAERRKLTLDLAGLRVGIYFVGLDGDEVAVSCKFIKR
ncbi:T9SS type A sorting domain-containing protein, partial [candidate division WOR-3 bacterium]|nr:T9SS type A sorting domain-containing protein [candidate division WOR-3 bacterium]